MGDGWEAVAPRERPAHPAAEEASAFDDIEVEGSAFGSI